MQEAAALDGCGPVTFYWRILVPVAQLGILSTLILIFTMVWNEFLIATALTQGPFSQMATPPLAIFIFLGRYFVSGLMAGTLK